MKRLVNRPAAGSAVVFTCDDETYQHLTLAIRRSGRVKGTEVQLRVDDHLRKVRISRSFLPKLTR
ncbi:TraY domain-containing protein [Klebsiella pneumoniae]|nr:TraY domain-containing protein [Klebsiella pneumoniae]QLR41093.1 TraY domain-containing protein [Klebsiella pneumoniae]RNP47331.1 TraY domain-containing protein [Klebsiella pneumoniae]HDT6018871.1 TraY domain-containing protein [Raoultella ornithinolytica]